MGIGICGNFKPIHMPKLCMLFPSILRSSIPAYYLSTAIKIFKLPQVCYHYKSSPNPKLNLTNIIWSRVIIVAMGKSKGGFYAVAAGRQTGIFLNWSDCEAQVKGFPKAKFKKFDTEKQATEFIENGAVGKVWGGSAAIFSSTTATNSSAIIISNSNKKEFHHQLSNQKKTAAAPAATGTSEEFSDLEIEQQSKAHEVLKRAGFPVSPEFSLNSLTSLKKSAVPTSSAALQKRGYSKLRDSTSNEEIAPLIGSASTTTNKKIKLIDSISITEGVVNSDNFTVDPAGYTVVYTDGACSNNGGKNSTAGIGVWFGVDHHLNLSEPVVGRQTNNTAEIQAAEKAILQAKKAGIKKLKIMTDSKFVIKCITEWIKKWKKNGWVLSTGKPVINREDLVKLEASTADIDIIWTYVPGHRGHVGNEAADRLAVSGAAKSL